MKDKYEAQGFTDCSPFTEMTDEHVVEFLTESAGSETEEDFLLTCAFLRQARGADAALRLLARALRKAAGRGKPTAR